MILKLLLVTFYISGFIGLGFTLLSMLFANLYDIKAAKRTALERRQPNGKWRRYHPLVTIVVPAYNEAVVIEATLRSLIASFYQNYEIVVVNDHSTDDTAAIVRTIRSRYPKKSIHLINRRTNSGKGEAITTGYRRYGHGELIMTLDADCIVERTTISRAVRYFMDPKVSVLAANVRILPAPTILAILQRFDFLVGFRNKKFYSTANCEYIVGGAGAVYRKSVFAKVRRFIKDMQTEDIALSLAIAKLGNKTHRLVYASDVVVSAEPAPTYRSLFKQRYRWKIGALQAIYVNRTLLLNPTRRYSKMLSWFRLPLALWGEFLLLAELFFFSFFLYRSIINHNPALYIGAFLTLTLITLISIWDDDHFGLDDKLAMSLTAPIAYPLFFIMTSIQVSAAFRCLANFRAIVGKTKLDGRWISPKRSGLALKTRAQAT